MNANAAKYDEIIQALVTASKPVCITAEAGCGKTTAIASAVKQCEGKQLILTHTNAGVAALRAKLRKKDVRESQYRVDTIDGWIYKYASAFREISGLPQAYPNDSNGWNAVRDGANRLFEQDFIGDILQSTYTGVFVDEYQDCSLRQHEIILKLCRYLPPVRVLGDPLQAIFYFNDPVDWDKDVLAHYQRLIGLNFPHRWHQPETNSMLGDSICDIRQELEKGNSVDLRDYPVIKWLEWSEQQEECICLSADKEYPNEQVVGIHASKKDDTIPNQQGGFLDHETAKRLKGRYKCLEEMICKDLMQCSKNIDKHLKQGNFRAISNEIKNLILRSCGNRNPFGVESFGNEFALLESEQNLLHVNDVLDRVLNNRLMEVYRPELLEEMKRTIKEFHANAHKYSNFEDAAWEARTRTRKNERKIDEKKARIISRLLLIKGLELHHAIVLNADKLEKACQFYVAITRGSKSLTVLSKSPIFHWQ